MYSLPVSVEVNGASFGIRDKGDFRMVLDCFTALNDEELSVDERTYAALIIFYEDFNSLDDLCEKVDSITTLEKEMYRFFNCGEETLSSNTNDHKLIDWDKDSTLICAAINNVAGKEVRALEYLHWWTFFGYYMSIGECPLSNIISIRNKIATNEKLDKYEKKFVQDNPDYFNRDYRSQSQKEIDDYVKNLWGEE